MKRDKAIGSTDQKCFREKLKNKDVSSFCLHHP